MKPNQQKILAGAIVILVVATVGYGIWKWRPANTPDRPDGTFWVCQNKACKNEFVLTMKEYADYSSTHPGQRMTCPKCNQQQAVAAVRCASCNKFVAKGLSRDNICPLCKREMTPRPG